jgi:hypothetical protein
MFRFIKQNRYIPILIVVVLAFILRIYQINKLPPGLYDDEVSLGYNAYSLLTYGTDEYGKPFPLWFRAFGEYKLPGYIYLDIIPIAIFGKNEFSVRLPSVAFGTLTTLFLYLFLQNLLSISPKPFKDKFCHLPLLSAFMLAILPWHIQFSRAAYESVVALCLYMAGCWQFIVFCKKKKMSKLIISVLLFTLASYTYNSFRVLTPITLLVVFYILFKTKYITFKKILSIAVFTIFIHIPLLSFTLTDQGYARLQETSTFTKEYVPVSKISQFTIPSFIVYPFVYLRNYLSYFSLREYFVKADDNVRFYSSSEFGFLFRWQLPFLVFGLIALLRENKMIFKKTILGALIIIPAFAAITVSPNALRTLMLTIPFSIITSIGILIFFRSKKNWIRIFLSLVILFGIFEIVFYFHMYLSHYEKTYTVFWGGAQEKIVKEATKYSRRYSTIVINNNMLPNEKIYFLFYNDKLKPIIVDYSWQKPANWTKPILYIRYPLPIPQGAKMKLLENISLDTPLKNEVAQFIEL